MLNLSDFHLLSATGISCSLVAGQWCGCIATDDYLGAMVFCQSNLYAGAFFAVSR